MCDIPANITGLTQHACMHAYTALIALLIAVCCGSPHCAPQGRSGTMAGLSMLGFDWLNGCMQNWFRAPGYMHTVVVTGLHMDTVYYYQCGTEHAWSPVHTFPTTYTLTCCLYIHMSVLVCVFMCLDA